MKRTSALAVALLFAASTLAAQSVDTRAVDRLFEKALKAWKIPGAAVAIVKDDRVVYVKGYGVKEIGKSEAVTPDSLFGIASTSKAFTTAAMAALVDEKKMSWDDPVRKHVEYFHLADPCADSLVTLRDLVTHRTGLSRHDELWDNTPLTREQVIRAAGMVRLSKPIRTAYQYNNIMFTTAGEAVASASKTPWSEFMRTRIFQPLGMTSTVTGTTDFLSGDHAVGHRYDRRNDAVVVQPFVNDDNLAAAGAIKSSARDMAQWLRFQLSDGMIDGKRIVSPEALGETKSPQFALKLSPESQETNPETNVQSYAMGWYVQDYAGALLVSHGGALNGYRTQVDLLPKQRAGFVVLINAGRGLATVSLRNALTDLLLGRPARDWDAVYLGLDQRSFDKGEKQKAEKLAKRRKDTKTSREIAAYAGTYESPAYGTATVTAEGENLVLRWHRLTLPLSHYHFDTFSAVSEIDDVDETVEFRLDEAGEVKKLTIFGEEFVRK